MVIYVSRAWAGGDDDDNKKDVTMGIKVWTSVCRKGLKKETDNAGKGEGRKEGRKEDWRSMVWKGGYGQLKIQAAAGNGTKWRGSQDQEGRGKKERKTLGRSRNWCCRGRKQGMDAGMGSFFFFSFFSTLDS